MTLQELKDAGNLVQLALGVCRTLGKTTEADLILQARLLATEATPFSRGDIQEYLRMTPLQVLALQGQLERHTPSKKPADPQDKINARLKEIILEELNVTPESIIPSARFIEDLCADSLQITEIIMYCEDAFHISIPDKEAEKIVTVSDLLEAIESKSKD